MYGSAAAMLTMVLSLVVKSGCGGTVRSLSQVTIMGTSLRQGNATHQIPAIGGQAIDLADIVANSYRFICI
ncbi:hypothetical protein F5Y16DRAFT_355395 [Xylariaceae sp. FL0255]|nr:hypothetical protein F5Y16DRAFT_355395 [Xylariaceae sp. FL0255]